MATYRKICTYQGNDILERLTTAEQAVLDRDHRNRKKKEDRKAEVGAWIGSIVMVGSVFFFCISWIIRG